MIVKTTLRCGDTLHVLVAASQAELATLVEQTTAKLLRVNGHSVEAADGSAVWIVDEALHPTQWHGDGNRVRANRVHCHRDACGHVSKSVLRKVWISAT